MEGITIDRKLIKNIYFIKVSQLIEIYKQIYIILLIVNKL